MAKYSFRLISMLTTVLSLLLLVSCLGGKPVNSIAPLEAQGLLKNDFAVLVDVREESEVKDGMVQGALWWPKSKIDAGAPEWKAFIEKHPKDKELVLYCRSGNRSGQVGSVLAGQGYKVSNMGGFAAAKQAGLPVMMGPPSAVPPTAAPAK